MSAAASPLETACERRFPAWTLYARAFSGNRVDADYLVQKAVNAAFRVPERPVTEAEIHGQVLTAIRKLAFRSIGPSAAAGGGATSSSSASASSSSSSSSTTATPSNVLEHLRAGGEQESKRWAASAVRRLRHLPRGYRRVIERALLRRPSVSLDRLAAHEGMTRDALVATIESGLRNVAASVRSALPGSGAALGTGHFELEALIAYVHGALSGDEARTLAAHAHACAACGDRLGTMMLLKAASTEAFTLPRISRSLQRSFAWALLFAGLVAGTLLVRHMMPNPWEAHATRETVPGWFQSFLYRGGDPRAGGELALGLGLLVDGRYAEAIETLEPLVEDPEADPEAATYLGIARYLTGDTSRGTLRLLESGTGASKAGRLARWYLANLMLARGDLEGATDHLRALATTRDWFGRAAETLIEELEEAQRPEGAVEAD